MTITLTHPTAGIAGVPLALELPPDLVWGDEFGWKQVDQTVTYTTTGAAYIEHAARQSGRPITLVGTQDHAWCARGALKTLRVWASQPGQALTLTLADGVARPVLFNHADGALQADPIVAYSDPVDTDPYQVTLKFLEL